MLHWTRTEIIVMLERAELFKMAFELLRLQAKTSSTIRDKDDRKRTDFKIDHKRVGQSQTLFG